jgi:hypothetical protein
MKGEGRKKERRRRRRRRRSTNVYVLGIAR